MSWRSLEMPDLTSVVGLADRIHRDLPEDPAIFEERFRLYPEGCFVCEVRGELLGYAVTHPWATDSVPALNSLIGHVPFAGTAYYLHDVALLDSARGLGLGGRIASRLKRQAARSGFREIGLVAVKRSRGFWERQGFRAKPVAAVQEKLSSYGPGAVYMQMHLATPRKARPQHGQ